ncbi:MAG: DUF3667 domain-containing protein [Bacteroidota bacterium]
MSDKYCSNCGQANSTKKLVLKDFFDEFFSSLVNYDSKLIKTFYTLLLKPGTITRDYIRGKRVAYTNPFRFLLSLAFLYFLMVSYSSNLGALDNMGLEDKIKQNSTLSFNLDTDDYPADSIQIPQETINALEKLDSLGDGIPGLPRELSKLDTLGVVLNSEIIDEAMRKEREKDSLIFADPAGYFAGIEKQSKSPFFKKMEFFLKHLQQDSLTTFEEAQQKYAVADSWSNTMAFNGANSIMRVIAQPGSWLNATMAKLPFVIFFFLPVFTVFITLVYIRKKYTYTDHLIFSFHNQSLLFILLILSWLVDTIFNTASAWIFLTIFSVYLFQAMRKFYGQGIFKTIVKYVFLNSAFMFLALFSMLLLFTGTVVTY